MEKAGLCQVTLSYSKLGDWHGEKYPIIFVHGLAASSAFWFRATEFLGDLAPMLTYDLRGHGRSSIPPSGYAVADHARDLIELMDFLHIEKATLIAHSFGGCVATRAVLDQPDRFRHLVLADTRLKEFQPVLDAEFWPMREEQRATLEQLGFELEDTDDEAGVSLLTALARVTLHAKKAAPDDDATLPRWVRAYFGRGVSRHSAMRWIKLVEVTSLLDDIKRHDRLDLESLKSLRLPLLALYGEISPLLPSGKQLKATRSEVELRIIHEAGHFFPAMRPKEFATFVSQFLLSHGSMWVPLPHERFDSASD